MIFVKNLIFNFKRTLLVQAKKLEGDKPVVNNALVGMDERQKTWATSMPNDWKTENPVLKRSFLYQLFFL